MENAQIDIHSLPFVLISERKKLPKIGAIYFVVENGLLVYIGKAQTLRYRWNNHKTLSFISISAKIHYLEFSDDYKRYWQERRYIKYYQPKFNIVDTANLKKHLAEKKILREQRLAVETESKDSNVVTIS